MDVHGEISIFSSIPQVIMTCLHGTRPVLRIADLSSKIIILQEHIRVKSGTYHWGPLQAGPALWPCLTVGTRPW